VGDEVRTPGGDTFIVDQMQLIGDRWAVSMVGEPWWYEDELTLVEPVIKWQRSQHYKVFEATDWNAWDDGDLFWRDTQVGTFADPKAVAEATQTLWNDSAKRETAEG